ncbi:hypothetical protein D3C86_1942200 [compost metagenome]
MQRALRAHGVALALLKPVASMSMPLAAPFSRPLGMKTKRPAVLSLMDAMPEGST